MHQCPPLWTTHMHSFTHTHTHAHNSLRIASENCLRWLLLTCQKTDVNGWFACCGILYRVITTVQMSEGENTPIAHLSFSLSFSPYVRDHCYSLPFSLPPLCYKGTSTVLAIYFVSNSNGKIYIITLHGFSLKPKCTKLYLSLSYHQEYIFLNLSISVQFHLNSNMVQLQWGEKKNCTWVNTTAASEPNLQCTLACSLHFSVDANF